MNKKFPFWLKIGLLFAAVALAVEILMTYMVVLIYGLPVLLRPVFYLSYVVQFPLTLLGWISVEGVLQFTDFYSAWAYLPNTKGIAFLAVVWFGIGAGLGRLYELHLKK